ncbi:MAG: prohibitin family protein [Candidatus Acidoferrales bacterium]
MARFQNDDPREIVMRKMQAMMPRTIGLLVAAGVVVLLLFMSLKYVPAGHVGVLVFLGDVTDTVLPQGTHFANPIARNNVMSVRTQELKEAGDALSNEGLKVVLDTSLFFHLDPQKANEVYEKLGMNYVDRVQTSLRSEIRSVTASHAASALYTGEREMMAQEIFENLRAEMAPRGIIVERVLLRNVKLPPTVTAAIEAKKQAEQEALRMEFVLQRERQEAERKRIEAAGIRDFQRIVAQGISAQLLTWKGIEATEKLASSTNAKVIVIGSGKSGLPLILGGQ